MLAPTPPKSTPFSRSRLAAATFDADFDVINPYVSGCQFNDEGTNISITATAADESAIEFYNSAASGQGGRIVEFGSTIAGTTGTMPFCIGAVEFNTNDDSSRDFVVAMGHGFDASGALISGAPWGGSGICFEQHYNPSGAINQAESYFRHWSNRTAGGPQQYRGFSITHQNHHLTDGTDTLLVGVSADTIKFQDATFVDRGIWTDSGLALQAGQAFSIASGIVSWNGTTGLMNSTATNNQYQSALTTDDHSCLLFSPVVNVGTSKTCQATYVNPTWTLLASSIFYGHRGQLQSTKSAAYVGFCEADVGVSGSGVQVTRAFGYRARIVTAASGQVVLGHGFWAQTPSNSGILSTCYGVKIDDHTGFHAIQTGTGKHVIGDATADTLIGVHGATPIVQQTVAAAATDLATAITLANSLRTLGINSGWFKA